MSALHSLPESYPPGATSDEQIANTWRATVVNSNLYVELHTELLVVNAKLSAIMAKLGIAWPTPLEPMRPEAPSYHSLEQMTPRVVDAAERGEKMPGTDAATEVRRIMSQELAIAEARENAKRLAKIDEDAKAAKDYRRQVRLLTLTAITGGLGLAGALELVKWLLSLHH